MTDPTGPTRDWEKLGRYLAGEASPDEAAAMRRWLDEHPSDAQVIAALDAATKGMAPAAPVDVEAALRRVKTRVRAPSRWRVVAWAAAAAAILVAGAMIARRRPVADDSGSARQYATGVGKRDSVVLEDGTRVLLGPASWILVSGRNVQLHGEAFFDVVHDEKNEFVVVTENTIIRDLGTKFSVHIDSARPVRVVVSEGAVRIVGALRDSAALGPGDVGVVEPDGRVQVQRGAATPDDLAWTRGRLVLRNAPVAEVAADLRRWYGVELRVTDTALLRRHFSGTFVADDSADRVLQVIALAFGARVERRDGIAYLRAAPSTR